MSRNASLFAFLVWIAAHAQAGAIQGKVTNLSGKALANAIVTFVPQGSKDTTGSDGRYSIATGSSGMLSRHGLDSRQVTFHDGVLDIALSWAMPIKVEVFDLRGKRMRWEEFPDAASGVYRLDIGRRSLGAEVCLVKVTIGREATTFHYAKLDARRGAPTGSSRLGSNDRKLARISAVGDSVKVSLAGYKTKTIPVHSMDTTLDVALDTFDPAGGYAFKNAPVPTSGCGKHALKSGTYKISSAGLAREYTLSIPANYDPQKPSRLIFGMHCMGSSMGGVVNEKYYQLQPYDADKNIIFVAPQGYTDAMPWRSDEKDHVFFDEIYKHLVGNLCVDSSRVFSVGFSFGAMYTNSISRNHQKVLRAVVVFAAADYNIYEPTPTHEPIAFMGTVGLGDGTCPPKTGRDCRNLKVADNKCTVPANVPETTTGSGSHVVYDYQGCGNHPVRWITFDGGHEDYPKDRNQSSSWMPAQTWSFINQF